MRQSSSPPERFPNASGYSLLELAMVVGIVLTISAIAIPAYTSALNKAEVVDVIVDLKLIANTLELERKGGVYPPDLTSIGLGHIRDPWGNPFQYVPHDSGRNGNRGNGDVGGGGGGEGEWRKDKNLVPINNDYDLWSMGPDGTSVAPLTAVPSRDDIIRANDGGFYGVASDY